MQKKEIKCSIFVGYSLAHFCPILYFKWTAFMETFIFCFKQIPGDKNLGEIKILVR